MQKSSIFAAAFAALTLTTVSSYAAVTFDGSITEGDWGSALATSAGGPSPGFGAGHEINAIYATGDASNIYFGIAGNVQDGNRILLFIDSKAGGFNTANFDRTGAPSGLNNFNSATTFDTGFAPDYAVVIGTNGAHSNFFFDLYTLTAGTGSNSFLGDAFTSGYGANPANSSTTSGFEFTLSKTALGYSSGSIQVFAAYTGDSGYLSNQFLTAAGSGDGNYTGGAVNFGAAAPNPITIAGSAIPEPSTITMLLGSSAIGGLFLFRKRRA